MSRSSVPLPGLRARKASAGLKVTAKAPLSMTFVTFAGGRGPFPLPMSSVKGPSFQQNLERLREIAFG
jgi:hypothetical protein